MLLFIVACSRPPDELSRPNRAALAPDGTVYVSDFQHDRVVAFAPDGAVNGTFGSTGIGAGDLWRVTAMTVSADGHLLVVNQRPATAKKSSAESRFELVRYADGDEVDRLTLDVAADGWVDAITETQEGTLVLADATHGTLTELDASGALRLGMFGPPLANGAPSALTADGDTLWVVEQHRHRLVQLDRKSELRRLEWSGQADRPRFPSAVASCPGGLLVVADFARHRVQRFDRSGRWIHTFTPRPESADQPVQLMDLRADPQCERLFLVDSKGDRVVVTDLNGQVLDELWAW